MNNCCLFDKNLKDYKEYVLRVQEALLENSKFISDEKIAQGIQDLNAITDPKKQLLLIKTSLMTDKELKRKPIDVKLETILMLSNIISNHYDQIENFHDHQILALAFLGSSEPLEKREDYMTVFASQDLLDAITNKTPFYGDRFSIYLAVKHQFLELDDSSLSSQNIEETRKNAIDFINNHTTKSMIQFTTQMIKGYCEKSGL